MPGILPQRQAFDFDKGRVVSVTVVNPALADSSADGRTLRESGAHRPADGLAVEPDRVVDVATVGQFPMLAEEIDLSCRAPK